MPLDGLAQKLADTAGDNPFFHSYAQDAGVGMWRPRRLSDLVSDRNLYRTRTYCEGLRPLGINRQISVLAGRPGMLSVRAWTVNRLHQDFTDEEVDLARHVQPMVRLLEEAYNGTRTDSEAARTEGFMLTPREQDVLHLVGNGLTATAIGHLLGISPRTVAKLLQHAYTKMGCTNRIDALRILRGP
jgi:DNA-binding CsgD family transcriptional regulator